MTTDGKDAGKTGCDCLQCRLAAALNRYQDDHPSATGKHIVDNVALFLGQLLGEAFTVTGDVARTTRLIERTIAHVARGCEAKTGGAVRFGIAETATTIEDGRLHS